MNTATIQPLRAAHTRSCLLTLLLGATCCALSACSSAMDEVEESNELGAVEKTETLTRAAIDTKSTSVAELPSTPGTGPLPIVGGTFEPNYKYPWVVRLNGCAGVLIDPQWVLTAAHCVTPHIGFGSVSYTRTDSYGNLETETRAPDPHAGSAVNPGVFIHPEFDPSRDYAADIALIKLAEPFRITFVSQTVGLPRSFRTPGTLGVLASIDHTGAPPAGETATFHGPIPSDTYAPKFNVTAEAAHASLCPGDSGSGFVTVESGRATVRGIASQGTITDCVHPSGESTFTDVYAFRDWILETLGKDEGGLTGNTRLRRSGMDARGMLALGCSSPNTPYWGPLNVPGVEEGADCDGGAQAVICQLDREQAISRFGPPQITNFTMTTTLANGTAEVRSLPFESNLAQFAGALPAGASREFICQIGSSILNLSNAGVQVARQ